MTYFIFHSLQEDGNLAQHCKREAVAQVPGGVESGATSRVPGKRSLQNFAKVKKNQSSKSDASSRADITKVNTYKLPYSTFQRANIALPFGRDVKHPPPRVY